MAGGGEIEGQTDGGGGEMKGRAAPGSGEMERRATATEMQGRAVGRRRRGRHGIYFFFARSISPVFASFQGLMGLLLFHPWTNN